MASFAYWIDWLSTSALGSFSELSGSHHLGFSEGDEERVHARKSTLMRDGFDLVLRFGQKALRELDAHSADLLSGSATDVLAKRLVQTAPGHPDRTGDVIHADGSGEVLRKKVQAACDARMVYRENVA